MKINLLDSETGEVSRVDMKEGVAYRIVPPRHLPEEWREETVWEEGRMRFDVNSLGKDGDGVRRFVKACGYAASGDNVDRIGREIRRTQVENERVESRYKEQGGPKLVDRKGRDVLAIRKKQAMEGKPPRVKMPRKET